MTAATLELDDLVAHEGELRAALTERAGGMYRTGPLGIIEVLVGSASFDQFVTRWDALVRLGRADAETIAQLRKTRAEQSRVVASLLERQQALSRKVRALDSAETKARQQLASSRAAYAAFQRFLAERAAASQRSRTVATRSRPERDAAPAPTPSTSDSTEPWTTALASWYGDGAVGAHTASGAVVGPDSMIVAHKTLPFGTLVEFSYGGRTALARVADRGPYIRGREFDLGPGIAHVLGFDGVAEVRYRVIGR